MCLAVAGDWIALETLDKGRLRPEGIAAILDGLGPRADSLRRACETLRGENVAATDPPWAGLYLAACELHREAGLEPYRDKIHRIVFTKHYDLGGSHYAYTEGQSDAQRERHFSPARLCACWSWTASTVESAR